jgi:hypothetical protein
MGEHADPTADSIIPMKDIPKFYMMVPHPGPKYLDALNLEWSCDSHCECPLRDYLVQVKIASRNQEFSDIEALRSHLVAWLRREDTEGGLADFEGSDGTILQDLLKKACHLCLLWFK